MKIFTSSAIALTLSALIGCGGGVSYTPMTKENRAAISSVELYNLVIQDEVKPSVEMSKASLYLGGGLIGAAIDSSVNKGRSLSAQDIIEPLYNVTEDVDYRKLISSGVNPAVDSEFNLKNKKETAEAILLNDDEVKAKVSELADDEALLYLSSFYNFVDNSKALATTTIAMVYSKPKKGDDAGDKKSKKKDEAQLVYFNRLNYLSDNVGEGAVHSMEMWSKDEGKLFKEVLNLSIQETVGMLMHDLQPELNEACSKSVKYEYTAANGLTRSEGTLVKQNTARDIVRAKDGALLSLSKGVKILKKKKADPACVS